MLFKDRLKVIERYYSWVEKHEKEEGIEIPKNFQSFMAYLDSRDLLVDPDGEYVKKADLLAKVKYYEDRIDSGFHYIEKDDIESLQTYSAHIDPPQEWTIDFSNIKDAESDNKGQWIKIENGYKCSECGHIMDKVLSVSGELIYQYSNYCPDCGADMRGDKAEESRVIENDTV